MFIGSINEGVRSIVREIAGVVNKLPVYVGCSGNFTVERILASGGVKEIHGNDVSLYSCAIGSYAAGRRLEVFVNTDEWRWLEDYLEPGPRLISALLLCGELFQFAGRQERYFQRMEKALRERFPRRHAETVEKVSRALDGLKLTSFFQGDIVRFAEEAPEECFFVTFPPTYEGGYERIYRKFDEVFGWDKPEYEIFTEERFKYLTDLIKSKMLWATLRDHEVEGMERFLLGRVQTSLRMRPVFVYSNVGKSRIITPRQRTEPVLYRRIGSTEELQGEVRLLKFSQGQLNTLRSEYLNPKIAPASAGVRLGVMVGPTLIGALAFDKSSFLGGWCDAYMMTDFPIRPSRYKRLSKLVLAVAVSTEVRAVLEQALRMKVTRIGTTAFTENASSMKYRGIFEVHSRKEGAVNYVADAGIWPVEKALEDWLKKNRG